MRVDAVRRRAGGGRRARFAAAWVALTALLASMFIGAAPAWADTVYELEGHWEADTPSVVQTGGAVSARWYFNLNDDAPAPGNEPVEPNVLTVSVVGAVFDAIPPACAVEGVDPVSQILDDGATLLCNVGTEQQGTAVTLSTGMRVTAATGEQVSASAEIGGQTVDLAPLTVQNAFLQDIYWETNANQRTSGSGFRIFEFNWTIFHGTGSPAGPSSVTYQLNVTNTVSGTTQLPTDPCQAFGTGTASGHPWSDPSRPAEQTAPFVGSCTLTRNSNTSFTLTIEGIDYSKAQVPTLDSTGRALPTDRQAVASGIIRIRLNTSQPSGQISVTANTPTYEAVDGSTITDDGSNNTSSQAWTSGVHYGGWRGSNNWSDTLRLARGTDWWVDTSLTLPNASGLGTLAGSCLILDTRYVVFNGQVETVDSLNGWADLNLPVEYYVANSSAPRLDPTSNTYDPNLATPCGSTSNWTSTMPDDPSTVWAIRTTYNPQPLSASRVYLRAGVTIREDVEVGQDVWMFSAYIPPQSGATDWVYLNRETTGSGPSTATPTPGARYPFSASHRDIMRVIGLEPNVSKRVSPTVVDPGGTATYTLTYSADGVGAVEPTVDDYEIVDTLPEGATYVAGSATPEPALSTVGGRQVLTWTLDGVETNAQHTLSYQVEFDSDIAGGSVLPNEVRSSVDGQSSSVATASVTINDAGTTQVIKTADQAFIPNLAGDGVGEGSWTVQIISRDPSPQDFTDTIDILPYNGDGRGTSITGTYVLAGPVTLSGSGTVYYTTADPTTLTDDPADPMHGSAGDPTGSTVDWTDEFTPGATAVRVITGALAPFETHAFTIPIVTDGMVGGDVLVNRAQGRAEHTRLVMRTSAETQIANYYSVNLKKYVQDADGEWRDANDPLDYPVYKLGDTVRYRIVVENTGQGTVTGLVITDDLFPEGSFTVEELAPGETESHEFSVTIGEDADDQVVNTACGEADIPEDSAVAPTINCDPAGVVVDGTPTHSKELVSAIPTGSGQWELLYRITVDNADPFATTYWLADELRFTDQATIVSAEVTSAPDGVTLADPAWDGRTNLAIASAVTLAGNDETDYEPHVYEVTVVAEVPLQLDGAGTASDPTDCPAAGSDAEQGFNNTSQLTDSTGGTETDQACAPIPSIDIAKAVTGGPVPNGDGTWTVTYTITASNAGAGAGTYDVTDRMSADGDLEVVSGEVTSAPDGVVPNGSWTGLGAEGAPENVIASDVVLPAGGTHTYLVEVVIGLTPGTEGAPVITGCDDLSGDEPGGVSNTADVTHNDLSDSAEACITVGVVVVDKTISSGPTPNGDGTWTIVYDLVATNVGSAEADYDLSDRLRYGDGIEIVSAELTTVPGGVTSNPAWTGLGAEGAAENVIASGVGLAAGDAHTYQVEVVVEMDEDTIDPAALQCPPPGAGGNGGLANSVSLDSNGIVSGDEVCASLPLIDVDKTIADGPAANGDGTWTITYALTVTNAGQAAGDYDLTDQLRYGQGVLVESTEVVAAPDGVETNDDWTGQGAAGAAQNVIAAAVTLPAGETHTYEVQVVVSLDEAAVSAGALECPEPGSGEPGGLANTAATTHNGESRDDEVCASLPLISIAKSLSGAVVPVDGQPGVYDATYEITVTNAGPGAGAYDLDDTLAPGEGVTVLGVQDVTTDAPDAVLNDGFDGLSDPRVVTDQPIAGAAGGPEVHTYVVTVRYGVDLSGVDLPDTDACTTGAGTVPGALSNVAATTWNGLVGEDDACVRPGKPTLDKALVSATPVGSGQWEVVYELTVGNVGGEATTYDLDDELRFAPSITVDSVSVTGPEGVDVNPAFDGADDQRITTGATIGGLDDDGYAPHVYEVRVLASVPLLLGDVEQDGTGSPSCTEAPGNNQLDQAFNNAAVLTDELGGTQVDTDCAPVPSIDIVKSLDGAPVQQPDGSWLVLYTITVSNDGGADGLYDLTDRLRYGAGITVRSATVTSTPTGVAASSGWTGQGADGAAENVIVAGATLPAGATHTYTVQVRAEVDTDAADDTTFSCPAPGSGEPGGFANTAGVAHNGLGDSADACAAPENPAAPPAPPTVDDPDTGAGGAGQGTNRPPSLPSTGVTIGLVAVAALLLLLGAVALAARRRAAR